MDANFLTPVAARCRGVWQFLAEHTRGRRRVELEQARNLGTAQAILLLPEGAELWETEPDGRTRIIRKPFPAAPDRSEDRAR
ncbi:hypothetical protein BJ973_004443 [Actinoplanes tereljensis]|uniref:Uncharacterized protein n=1 Tax=Paractinoplanes tereljensis TaxID=571912 RepID=A0A919NUP6_9ACTN|nr:hypothetical protein [Actinoplanes tereljensis]GIF23832.1 hypothetical protein Ate02nite_65620 [Actinoplanes tereljensis]